MKSSFYLAGKYIKSHTKQFIGITLCVSLFLFAFLTILWYSDSYQYSIVENNRLKNGSYEVICFYADEQDMEQKKNELVNKDVGIINGLWQVENEHYDNIWVGSSDEIIEKMLPLRFLSGKMPETENEIAIEENTYNALSLDSKVGDSIELNIKDVNGNIKSKSFILSGITDNFSHRIRSAYSYQMGELSLPTMFTINSHTSPQYTHIFAEHDSFVMRNLNCRYTYINGSYAEIANKFVVNKIVILPIKIFFVVTTIMGVLSVAVYFFKKQETYLRLLRCIDFSKKKSRYLLLTECLLLWVASSVLSVIGAVLALLFLQFISSFSSQTLFLHLSPLSFIFASLLTLMTIIITFGVLLNRFYRVVPLRETIHAPKKQRSSEKTLKHCWHKAYSSRYRLQNGACIMVILFCVGMSILGPFIPLFNARGSTFENPDDFPDNADYSLHMTGGTSSPESYYINFPIDSGVSRKLSDQIISDHRVKVLDASVSHLCVPFFLTSKTPKNRLLYKYAVEAKQHGYNYVFEHHNTDKMIRACGGDSNTDILVELPVKWQSYTSLLNSSIECNEGLPDEWDYKEGTAMIAPHELCSVGDEFTMVIPVADAQATEQNIENHIRFETITATVTATYSGNELILSTEYLFSINPNLNYENLVIENLENTNSFWVQELENKLETIANFSVGVKYDNYAQMSKEFYAQVNLETLQIIVSVLMFLIIVLIAIIFSNYVQVRSNLKSYILMRTVGAKIETVKKLIISEMYHTLNIGIISGSICGGAVVVFLSIAGSYIKLWDIYLFYVAPVYILTIVFLYFGCRIAVKKAVHTMINSSIIENLNKLE